MLASKRRPVHALTPSHEHYLRAIWAVHSRAGYARVVDVARELGVSHATLSVGIKGLEHGGLVRHDARRFLILTPKGERIAREVHHRFRVVQTFLHDILGIDAGLAEREACLLEHDVSDQTTDRLVDLLRLLQDDPQAKSVVQERLAHYHRSCATGAPCATCGLSCVTTVTS